MAVRGPGEQNHGVAGSGEMLFGRVRVRRMRYGADGPGLPGRPPRPRLLRGVGATAPPLMEPATYAVEPRPSGPPWRLWDEVGEELAAEQGVYLPQYCVSFGSRGAVVIAPGDSRGMALIPEKCAGHCMGIDGRDGPNLACEGCGRAVATRMDDCGLWQTVWLEPAAVRRVPSGLPAVPVPGWDELVLESYAVPPVELDGSWSRRWAAAVPVALAHLVVACEGRPVALPGPLAELVGATAGCLPAGPSVLTSGLAGPGTPVPRSGADVLLVPRHPVTGEPWRPAYGGAPSVVPLDIGVWAHLVLPGRPRRCPPPARCRKASCAMTTPCRCARGTRSGPTTGRSGTPWRASPAYAARSCAPTTTGTPGLRPGPAGSGPGARRASSPPGSGTWRPPRA